MFIIGLVIGALIGIKLLFGKNNDESKSEGRTSKVRTPKVRMPRRPRVPRLPNIPFVG
jgi:hypothetical protein